MEDTDRMLSFYLRRRERLEIKIINTEINERREALETQYMPNHDNMDKAIKIYLKEVYEQEFIYKYRKPTHTNQYFLYTSEPPTSEHYITGRYQTARIDRKKRTTYNTPLLCQDPKRSIGKGKLQAGQKEKQKKSKKNKTKINNQQWKEGLNNTSIYVWGITGPIQSIMRKHQIHTVIKSY